MSGDEMDEGSGGAGTVLRMGLYVEEPVLSAPQCRLVREAGVGFGRPTVHPVRADQLGGLHRLRPDLGHRQFMVVQFPFDLEALPANRWYQSATILIELDDDAVVALDATPPTYEGQHAAEDETVQLDVRGVGRHRIAWDLRAVGPDAPLRPRSHVMQVILDAPAGTVALSGTLDAEAVVRRRLLGLMTTTRVAAQAPTRFTLGTDGAFEVETAAGRR